MRPHALPPRLWQIAARTVNIRYIETFPAQNRLVSVARASRVSLALFAVNKTIYPTGSQTRTSNTLERTELPKIRKPYQV